MNDYRHVCFKDLDNYFKRSDYLGGLTEIERNEIRKNLNVPSCEELEKSEGGIVIGTYEQIKELADNNNLDLTCVYIINDFQTIYKSNTDEVWGLDVEPSAVYSIVLYPISENQFSKDVHILEDGIAKNWIVRYDFSQKEVKQIKTKGEIIYLQDEHNNSAYFDFKNIKFAITLSNDDITALRTSGVYNVYTFSKYRDGEFIENSIDAYNNTFDYGCDENLFLGTTQNNHFYGGFKRNVFIKNCECNKFEWDTSNNKFTENISHSSGSIKNAIVTTNTYDSAISKEFKMLHNQQQSKPVFVVTYLDGETLTNQVIMLDTK